MSTPTNPPLPPSADAGAPDWVMPPAAANHRSARPRPRWILILTAAAVLVVATAVGITFIQASTALGGSSPTDAVTKLADAVAHQDTAKAISVMNPAETQTLKSLLNLARGKLAPTSLVTKSGALEPWVTMSVSGLQLSSFQPASNIAFVTVNAGTLSWTADEHAIPAARRPANPTRRSGTLPLSDVLSTGISYSGQRLLGTQNTSNSSQPTTLALLKLNGRWYVSVTTTVLEQERRALALPNPSFNSPTTLPPGASDPSGVLTGLVSAIQSHQTRAAAGFVSPSEMPGLPWYYASFAAEMDTWLAKDTGQITGIDTSVQPMSNGYQKVIVHGFTVTAANGAVQYREGCVTTAQSPQPRCLNDQTRTLLGSADAFIVVRKEAGSWRFSPVATALENARLYLSKGSINSTLDQLHAPQLAPVTATIQVGSTKEVTFNDAGFTHVVLTGRAGACVHVTDSDTIPSIVVPSADTCGDTPAPGSVTFTMPNSGRADVIAYNTTPAPGSATLTTGQ